LFPSRLRQHNRRHHLRIEEQQLPAAGDLVGVHDDFRPIGEGPRDRVPRQAGVDERAAGG